MGLDFGFNKAKKYKDTTVLELYTIQSIFDWESWNSKTYSLEDYLDEYCGNHQLPEQDKIDFYRQLKNVRGAIWQNVRNLCGWDNLYLCNEVASHLTEVREGKFTGITPKVLSELYAFVDEELDRNRLIPVSVLKGIRDTDNGEEAMFPLTGLVVEDENENNFIHRINEYSTIYIPSKGYDDWKHAALLSFRESLDLVSALDPEDYIVWYYVSY